ncbi:MAG: gamma-glutamyl-gamma-aminobutyrate hydrolase family protein [Oscillospiraceae bacterium]|jgi:putative glutamine amidotransferase|nr:gamma-glutamyl-gamma-aminobutyrate hydrolase family protein [Oscillospiraceae bacterium]
MPEKTSVPLNFSSKQCITYISDSYLDLIKECGAIPFIIPADISQEKISDILKIIDGLILPGGRDIHPSCYGDDLEITYSKDINGCGKEFYRPIVLKPDIEKDKFEINFYLEAINYKIPVIGICRGMQIMNVAHGGTLFQEIPPNHTIKHSMEDDEFINYHSININKQSKTYNFFNVASYFTSSVHHQAVNKLGDDLQIGASSDDNIIEIIEHKKPDVFAIGIQGHPEKTLTNLNKFKKIFEEFTKTMYGGKNVKYT